MSYATSWINCFIHPQINGFIWDLRTMEEIGPMYNKTCAEGHKSSPWRNLYSLVIYCGAQDDDVIIAGDFNCANICEIQLQYFTFPNILGTGS